MVDTGTPSKVKYTINDFELGKIIGEGAYG